HLNSLFQPTSGRRLGGYFFDNAPQPYNNVAVRKRSRRRLEAEAMCCLIEQKSAQLTLEGGIQ
ncbi:MAG: hypothetical protein JSU67_04290, partial [Gammaproteobacteria bacterium]